MSDVPFCSSENACTEGGEQTNGCEPVCINVSRIYDSCGAKDCLSNLPKQTRKLLMGLVP